MKKQMKSICLILSAVIAFSAIPGCGSKKVSNSKQTELKMMLFGSKPNYFEEILQEFENRTKNTLNVKLNIEWSPLADHKEKLLLRMTTGEAFDLVFDAPFANMNTLVTSGAYVALDDYFKNPNYPGLSKMFSEDYINANRMNGKLYGFPLTDSYAQFTTDCVILRGDLRKKYGLPEVKTREDYQRYLDTILANEPGVIPLCLNNRRGYYHLLDTDETVYCHKQGIYQITAGGIPFDVAISPDHKKVLGASYYGDPDSYREGFPDGYKTVDYRTLEMQRDWRKYLEPDSINQKDPESVFYGGKAASFLSSAASFVLASEKLKSVIPEAEAEMFTYYKPTQGFEAGGWQSTFQAWNFLCIPKTSTHIDKTLEFMNWIFSDRENHDLFEYGIEGKHWIASGDNEFTYPDGISAENSYNFPGFELTFIPAWTRLNADLPDNVKACIEYARKDDTYEKNPLSGFVFDGNGLKTESAKVAALFDDTVVKGNHGLLTDPKAEFEKVNEQARAQGLDAIRNELLTQIQAFLDVTYR